MKRTFLSPLLDLIFKRLFGDPRNKDVLTSLLKATLDLPCDEFSDMELLDTYLRSKFEDGKLAILDIKVRLKSGKIVDIEVQVIRVSAMRSRILYYTAQMVVEQLSQGDEYDKIKPVIAIVIADHSLITEESDYHNVYYLANKKSHKALTNLLEIHTIELKKLPKKGDGTLLGNWIRFLKSKTEKEFEMVAQTDPMIKKAVDLLEQLSQDKELRAEIKQRAKALSDFNTSMSEARNEGVQEERERANQKFKKAQERAKQKFQKAQERSKQELQEERERAKQDKQRSVHNLKQENVPLQSIADALGLTLEEVERL